MTISVIIATYNRNDVLCQTVQCLLDQSDRDFEIIIVDQSKSHNSATLSFLENHKGEINYIKTDIPNLPAARNLGIEYASGEIIMFIDDDVLFKKDTVAVIKRIFIDHSEIGGLTGLSWSNDMNEEDKWGVIPAKNREEAKKRGSGLFTIHTLPGFFMIFRKAGLLHVKGFDEWIGTQPKAANEDGELCLRLKLSGRKLFVSPEIEVKHLAETSGGCEVRQNYDQNINKVRNSQYNMAVYGLIKNKKQFKNLISYYMELARILKSYLATYNYKLKLTPELLYSFFRMVRQNTNIVNQNNS